MDYNGSATIIGHYYEGNVPYFPLYSPSNDDYRTSISAVQILVELQSVSTFYITISNILLQFSIKLAN